MKHITLIITFSLALFASGRIRAEDSIFAPLVNFPDSKEEQFFKVVKGEVQVEGEVVKLIVVKSEHLTVSYKNDSPKDLYPRYTVKIYNQYGYLLGSEIVGASLFGGGSRLEPGDVGGEKIHLDLIDIKGILKHTNLKLPDDFLNAGWLSLSKSNTKLTKEGAADKALPSE